MEVYYAKSEKIHELVEYILDINKNDLVAIKIHVGERGNPYYVPPRIVKEVVNKIKEEGGKPFLTDTSTWYLGSRYDGIGHIETALANGFNFAPFIPADGSGLDEGIIKKSKGILDEVEIGRIFGEVDYLFVISHTKGHCLTGFGGALKNIGMGCAVKRCKLAQHKTVDIVVDKERCVRCGKCVSACKRRLPTIINGKLHINTDECMRCPNCSNICPENAISLQNLERLQLALISVCEVVKKMFDGRWGFLNCGINISEECDCLSNPGRLIHSDVGYFSSSDPVGIDKAFLDMVGAELFEKIHGISPLWQIREGEKLGVGSSNYKLVKI